MMCENCFPVHLNWRSKDSVVMKFERCEHRSDTSIIDGDQEGVKC